MGTECFVYDVTELYDSVIFKKGMELLPWPDRREKVMRYRYEKDRCLSLGAGLLAAYALGKRMAAAQLSEAELELAYTERGKPYLLHHPEIHFSISHSGRLAVCAVSDVPVGIDVEEIRRFDAGVAALAFSAEERDWLAAQADGDRAFTRLWTRKESYLKMTGEGITDELQAISVQPGADEDDAGLSFEETGIPGHMICVCVHDTSPMRPK